MSNVFIKLPVRNRNLFCFNFNQQWYFLLAHFCDIFSFDQPETACQYFEKSLQDFAQDWRLLRKKEWIFNDLEKVVDFIHRVSHKAQIFDGKIETVASKQFEKHAEKYKEKSTVIINFRFFCRYLQEMYGRWESRRTKLSLSESQFSHHLIDKYKCKEWAHLLENMDLLESIADQYINGNPPQQDRERETDELLSYLELLQTKNRLPEKVIATQSLSVAAKTTTSPKQSDLTISTKRKSIPAQKKLIKRRKLSPRDKLAIAALQKWKCGRCQKQLDDCFETDHIERFCETGNDHHENLWALCPNCHAWKTEMDRKRQKSHIWSNFQSVNDETREQRRLQILAKVSKV